MLVDAEAVHQPKDLLAVLSHARLALSRQRLLVQNRPLYRSVQSHPLVLLDLGHGQTLRWVQDQHPADKVLTVWVKRTDVFVRRFQIFFFQSISYFFYKKDLVVYVR